jgi:glutathione peroxidase
MVKKLARWSAPGVLFAYLVTCLPCLTPAPADEQESKPKPEQKKPAGIYDFTVTTVDGKPVKLGDYAGDVLLIVNVASKCGLTKTNYQGLGPLYAKYKDQGFRVLAFPANNFLGQEPGTNEEIKRFCTTNYDVQYDLFAKVSVKGDDICPLYKFLTEHPDPSIRGEVQWNFQKYVVARDGKVLSKFAPRTPPDDPKLVAAIEEALKSPRPAKTK